MRIQVDIALWKRDLDTGSIKGCINLVVESMNQPPSILRPARPA